MGQQQTTMTVAEEEKGGSTLRRMILVLAAAALMAAMMALMAAPAFASANPGSNGKAADAPGQTQAQENAGQTEDRQSANGVMAGGGPKQGIPGPTNAEHFYQLSGSIGNDH